MDADCAIHCDPGCQCRDCWRCTPKGQIPVAYTPTLPPGFRKKMGLATALLGLVMLLVLGLLSAALPYFLEEGGFILIGFSFLALVLGLFMRYGPDSWTNPKE